MHSKQNNSQMKAIDQVIFFLISISSFLWISVNITGLYLSKVY